MPRASLGTRLKTSPWLRRLLPTPLALRRGLRRGQAVWERSPEAREDAIAAMATIVTGTPREAELDDIARRHVSEMHVFRALFWQPWSAPILDAQSKARLREALCGGRGALLSNCHIGPHYGSMAMLKPLDYVPYAVAGAWFFEKPAPSLWGRRVARWRKGANARLLRAKGSFGIVQALLQRGELVYLFFDMPGSRETRFLDKPAMLADGSARLAVQADALILPLRTRRVGHRTAVDVAAPLDPRSFSGVEELHNALAACHERWILERPAEMEDPREFGWAGGATPEAWNRPTPTDQP